jgi:hypothetical protein
VLADVTEELEVADAAHPVAVVDDMHPLPGRFEDPADLPLHAGDVGGQFCRREEVAFLAASARISDHPGRATDERHRLMSGGGHTTEEDQRHEMPDVEAVGGGVEPGVDPAARGRQPSPQASGVGRLVDEAAGLEIGEQIGVHREGSSRAC